MEEWIKGKEDGWIEGKENGRMNKGRRGWKDG